MSHAELADETNAKAFLEKDNYQIKLLNQCWYFYRKNTARKQCFYFTIDSDTLPFARPPLQPIR